MVAVPAAPPAKLLTLFSCFIILLLNAILFTGDQSSWRGAGSGHLQLWSQRRRGWWGQQAGQHRLSPLHKQVSSRVVQYSRAASGPPHGCHYQPLYGSPQGSRHQTLNIRKYFRTIRTVDTEPIVSRFPERNFFKSNY